MRSLSLLNPRAFLLLIVASLLLISVRPAYAQPGAKADTSNVRSRMAIITAKSRSVLRMDVRLARIHFSLEQLRAVDPSTKAADISHYVRSAQVWTEEARTNQANRSSSTVRGNAAQQFEMRVTDPALRSALLKHHLKRIVRVFSPPYDTQRVTKNGQVADLKDLSLHYNIIFPDSTHRNDFLVDVKKLRSLVQAQKPPAPGRFGLDVSDVPPDDLNGALTDQWGIDDNVTYGVNMLDACKIIKDLNINQTQSTIAFIEPNVGGQGLDTVSHPDLENNIDV